MCVSTFFPLFTGGVDEHLTCNKEMEKRQVVQELHSLNSKINFVEKKKSLLTRKLKLNT